MLPEMYHTGIHLLLPAFPPPSSPFPYPPPSPRASTQCVSFDACVVVIVKSVTEISKLFKEGPGMIFN